MPKTVTTQSKPKSRPKTKPKSKPKTRRPANEEPGLKVFTGRANEVALDIRQYLRSLGSSAYGAIITEVYGSTNYTYVRSFLPKGKPMDWLADVRTGRYRANGNDVEFEKTIRERGATSEMGQAAHGAKIVESLGPTNHVTLFYVSKHLPERSKRKR